MAALAAAARMLAAADRRPGSSRVAASFLPRRVASSRPASGAATARISSSLLAGGSLKACAVR
ncbi:MAG: hypothetical protein ACLPN6_26410 [Streptosporangiaceae bacterium]|nr:hypothetical protein [Actinomycetota bacterium]